LIERADRDKADGAIGQSFQKFFEVRISIFSSRLPVRRLTNYFPQTINSDEYNTIGGIVRACKKLLETAISDANEPAAVLAKAILFRILSALQEVRDALKPPNKVHVYIRDSQYLFTGPPFHSGKDTGEEL
jgi:hypothetical protein